jgi:hypothetical protein
MAVKFSTVLPIFWQASAVRCIGAERAVLVATLCPMPTILLLGEFLVNRCHWRNWQVLCWWWAV